MVTTTFLLGTVSGIRNISFLNINPSFAQTLYMSVVLYAPSLALSQVTGLNIWLAVGSCGLVCTIYTSIVSMHFELRVERMLTTSISCMKINIRVVSKLSFGLMLYKR